MAAAVVAVSHHKEATLIEVVIIGLGICPLKLLSRNGLTTYDAKVHRDVHLGENSGFLPRAPGQGAWPWASDTGN